MLDHSVQNLNPKPLTNLQHGNTQVRSSAATLSRALVSEALLLSEKLTNAALAREGGHQGGGSAAALKLSKSLRRAQKKLKAGLGAARKALISGAVSMGGGPGGLVSADCDPAAASTLPMQPLPGLKPMHVEDY